MSGQWTGERRTVRLGQQQGDRQSDPPRQGNAAEMDGTLAYGDNRMAVGRTLGNR